MHARERAGFDSFGGLVEVTTREHVNRARRDRGLEAAGGRKLARDRVHCSESGQCSDVALDLKSEDSQGKFAVFLGRSLGFRLTYQFDQRRRQGSALVGRESAGAIAQSEPAQLVACRSVLLQPDDQRGAPFVTQGFLQLEDCFVRLSVTRMNAPE